MKSRFAAIAVVVCIVAVLFFFVRVGKKGVFSRQPTPAEKQLLVPVTAFSGYGLTNLNLATCESYLAKQNGKPIPFLVL